MGEVVVSSEGGMELEAHEIELETELAQQAEGAGSGAADSVVRWERFLPKMAVRVLLVEADDSTRQIIAALLRKCSYRVAAVADGLKAWEVLKGRPHNIDLILTEVELPSISGYALLTLIMEHEVCKNIPVIMMSSHDSVSTVYKCMLRGATDFLVKPVRKNELRNLWQHVWRKQASSTAADIGLPDESVPQQKDEATAENNAISNHSSDYVSCIPRDKECVEKGSDAQSSCTKPELETEGEDSENVCCLSQLKSNNCLSDDINIPTQEECHQESRKREAHDNETGYLLAVTNAEADYAISREAGGGWEQVNDIGRSVKNHHALENSSREAIDLIGAFDNHHKGTFGSSNLNFTTNKFDISPLLDLSLRRSHPSRSVNQVNDERKLNHSDASAFSWYIHKPSFTSSSICNKQKDHETNSEKNLSNHTPYTNSDTHGPTTSSSKDVSMSKIQTGQLEITFSYSQNREISHPVPVRNVRYENVINTSGSVMPSSHHSQSGPSPLPSPSTPHHSESFPQLNTFYPSDRQPLSAQQLQNLVDQRFSNSIDQTDNKPGNKLENMEDHEHVSPGNDQSANSSYCNANISHQNGSSGSNGKINSISVINATSECCNEESYHVHERASHRSTEREAALTKFRLKRKGRCFEKKVRYESRKKLAEQRPRVKGQFVRQMPNDAQPGNSSAG